MNKLVEEFLLALNLSQEECKIYLTLSERGPLTILELSRYAGINRTKVYRLTENLLVCGVIEKILDEHHHVIKAADINTLELLVNKQEIRATQLRNLFPHVAHILSEHAPDQDPQTKVLFYAGKDGIKRMVWHTLRAQKVLYGYSYRSLEEVTGKQLANRWRDEWVSRKLEFRELYSDEYKASIDAEKLRSILAIAPSLFQSRYISSDVLNINHQMDIYNDVVAYYSWNNGEIFGVELYNEKIAEMQKQLFNLAWLKSEAT